MTICRDPFHKQNCARGR